MQPVYAGEYPEMSVKDDLLDYAFGRFTGSKQIFQQLLSRYLSMSVPDIIIDLRYISGRPLALIDFDRTMVKPKKGIFPRDRNDWQYLTGKVKSKIIELSKTYDIVIVTNQTKMWKLDMIMDVVNDIGVPITVCIHNQRKKPNTYNILSHIQITDGSFMVGDADGKHQYKSTDDLDFAKNLNVPFYPPESLFY